MNYLAHIALAEDHAHSRIGQLLGDFARGATDDLRSSLPGDVVDAIEHHRAIDRWTDDHPLIQESKEWIAPERSRFRGVIVDILLDHFLVLEWTRFHDLPLRVFLDQFYDELRSNRAWLPEELASDLDQKIAHDWLGHYGDEEGLDGVFYRTSRRHPKFAPIAHALEDLHAHRAGFHRMFLRFFPELVAFTCGLQGKHPS